MKTLPDFKLETYFSKWEFNAKYHMTASDAESMLLSDLLAMATPEERHEFEHMSLRYTQTYGEPDLRNTIAKMNFSKCSADEILCLAGASEGIFVANNIILNSDSHAIALTPNYQSHESLPDSICEITGVPLDPPSDTNANWSLDIDRVSAAIQKNTKLLTINFPHNPTTATVTPEFYVRLVAMAKEKRFYIISDIAYGDITFGGYVTPSIMSVPGAKDVAVESFTFSKSYNMAGWRVGFFVGNKKLIGALQKIKSWLDYGMFTPIQVAATVALNGDQQCVRDITDKYDP